MRRFSLLLAAFVLACKDAAAPEPLTVALHVFNVTMTSPTAEAPWTCSYVLRLDVLGGKPTDAIDFTGGRRDVHFRAGERTTDEQSADAVAQAFRASRVFSGEVVNTQQILFSTAPFNAEVTHVIRFRTPAGAVDSVTAGGIRCPPDL